MLIGSVGSGGGIKMGGWCKWEICRLGVRSGGKLVGEVDGSQVGIGQRSEERPNSWVLSVAVQSIEPAGSIPVKSVVVVCQLRLTTRE